MPRKPRLPKRWQRQDRHGDWYVKIKGKPRRIADGDAPPQQVQQALPSLLTKADAVVKKDDGPVLPFLERFL